MRHQNGSRFDGSLMVTAMNLTRDSKRLLPPRGTADIIVRSVDGYLVTSRHARNIVLRSGAELIAQRFAGVDAVGPIDRVRIGFGTEVATSEVTALTAPADSAIPAAALETALTPAAFTIASNRPGIIAVSVNAVFLPTVDLTDVTEAALASGTRLYNQVVFEPLQLRIGQNVTFFWQIDFPFG